jgi:hypothetical protein
MTALPDSTPRYLRGAKAIGKALNLSSITVRRMIQKGTIRAAKLNGKTSPWTVDRAELARFRAAIKSNAEVA